MDSLSSAGRAQSTLASHQNSHLFTGRSQGSNSSSDRTNTPTPTLAAVSSAGVLEGRPNMHDGGVLGGASRRPPQGQQQQPGDQQQDALFASAMDALGQMLSSTQHSQDAGAIAAHLASLLASVLSDPASDMPTLGRFRKRSFVALLVDRIGADGAAQAISKAMSSVR